MVVMKTWPKRMGLKLATAGSELPYLLNTSRSPACISATRVLVIEVPMLAPMMMGTAARTVSTGV